MQFRQKETMLPMEPQQKKIKELTALVGYALLSLELEDACVRETMYSIFFSLRRLLKYKRSLRLVIRTRRIIR